MFEAIDGIDFAILGFIRENLTCPFLDAVMPVITLLGEGGIFWIAAAILLLCLKKTRKTGLAMAFAMVLGLVVCNLTLKPLVARIRPYEINTAVALIVKPLADFSFPSGHTLVCFECGGVLWHFNKKIGASAFALGALVAFSRIYLYVHYPSDVVFSVLLGLLFAFVALRLAEDAYERLFERRKSRSS